MKQLRSKAQAREVLFAGVQKLNEQVQATMGPSGRNILLEKYGVPIVTKDGVTVAEAIHLPDRFEDMGCQLVKQAARETNETAGDGTTTATVLAHSMIKSGMKKMKRGANAISIKRGMGKARDRIIEQLMEHRREVKDPSQYEAIATISSQDPEIGKVVSGVMEKVGDDGIITTQIVPEDGIDSEIVEGMEMDYALVSPYFINDPKNLRSVQQNVPVLITDKVITHFKQILPILSQLREKIENKETEIPSIFIVCRDMRDEALVSSVVNKQKGELDISVVKFPEVANYNEMMEDLAALTGATVISSSLGLRLEAATIGDLGGCMTVIAERSKSTFIGGVGDTTARITELQSQLSKEDNEATRKRLAKLKGGVGIVRIGASTEVEQVEFQHRVDDAIAATKAAAKEGILPGGGTAYLRCINDLDLKGDEKVGAEIVYNAILTPTEAIADNAGHNGVHVRKHVQKFGIGSNIGFNALTGEYEDLFTANVIDPMKVSRVALENAVSVASMLLTIEGTVCDMEKKEPPMDYAALSRSAGLDAQN